MAPYYSRQPLQSRTLEPPPPHPGPPSAVSHPVPLTKPDAAADPPPLPELPDDTLAEIFTHRSISSSMNYEALEAIGDRVAGLAAVDMLQYREPDFSPCLMSRFQMQFCSDATFSRSALRCGFAERIASVHQPRLKVLADVFEAAVGAIFLEHGYGQAYGWFEAVMEHDYEWPLESARGYAYEQPQHPPPRPNRRQPYEPYPEERYGDVYVKQNRLEALARERRKYIEYEVVLDGRHHRRGLWKVAVYDDDGQLAIGRGWTETLASENAAAKALRHLGC